MATSRPKSATADTAKRTLNVACGPNPCWAKVRLQMTVSP
jgi:hypothetical protein